MRTTDNETLYDTLAKIRAHMSENTDGEAMHMAYLSRGEMNVNAYLRSAFDRIIFKYPKAKNDINMLFTSITHDYDHSVIPIFNDMSNRFRPGVMNDLLQIFNNLVEVMDNERVEALVSQIQDTESKLNRTVNDIRSEFLSRIKELEEERDQLMIDYQKELHNFEFTQRNNLREYNTLRENLKHWKILVEKMKGVQKFLEEHQTELPSNTKRARDEKAKEARARDLEYLREEERVRKEDELRTQRMDEALRNWTAEPARGESTLKRERSVSPRVERKIRDNMHFKKTSALVTSAFDTRAFLHSKTSALFY